MTTFPFSSRDDYSQREADYEEGYQAGFERWKERVERLELMLADLQKRYDYLLNLKTDELLLRPPEPIIIRKEKVNE